MQGAISEADLKAGLDGGGKVMDVVVVRTRAAVTRTRAFVPYLRLSWRRGYHGLALYRDRGLRSYNDIRPLLDRVEDEWGFGGDVRLLPLGSPQVARLGLLVAG